MNFVYMVKDSKGNLYIGITRNIKQRLHYHNNGQGAVFTKFKSKFAVVFIEEQETLAEARKREIQIKKWRRDKKEMLIKKFQKGLPTKL